MLFRKVQRNDLRIGRISDRLSNAEQQAQREQHRERAHKAGRGCRRRPEEEASGDDPVGATTVGERHAAAAAIDRVRKALAVASQTEQPVETQFTLSDQWSRRLFTALCRRYGLAPYRYRRQRHTTVVVRAPRSFINNTLWPEFLQIKDALDEYLNEATERIIREEVYGNSAEAPERAE